MRFDQPLAKRPARASLGLAAALALIATMGACTDADRPGGDNGDDNGAQNRDFSAFVSDVLNDPPLSEPRVVNDIAFTDLDDQDNDLDNEVR